MISTSIPIDRLLDWRALGTEEAVSLARSLGSAEPQLDVRLMRKLLGSAGGDAGFIPTEAALRALRLVESISDGSRLTAYLIQLLRHPSGQVRSKAALLLGRANLNLARIREFLAADDPRLRANAVESLWGQRGPEAKAVMWQAAKNPHVRTAINALVGLCQAGDAEARTKLVELAASTDAAQRSGAAWAMGQLGDPEFSAALETLSQDGDQKVRNMALRSGKRLRPAVA